MSNLKVFVDGTLVGECKNPYIQKQILTTSIVKFKGSFSYDDLKRFKFSFEGIPGIWVFENIPLHFQHNEVTIVSNYGPCTPLPDKDVEFRREK